MDLYTLLGVTRAATAGEIERAYRKLARRYHPGINPGDRVAEEMFRQIQRAYDVLVDLEQRSEYDRGAQVSAPGALEATVSFEAPAAISTQTSACRRLSGSLCTFRISLMGSGTSWLMVMAISPEAGSSFSSHSARKVKPPQTFAWRQVGAA